MLFKFVTFASLLNLSDFSVGSVPVLNSSLVIKSLGVYSLGSFAGYVSFSTSTLEMPPGFLKVLPFLNIPLPTFWNNLSWYVVPNTL